NRLSGSKDGELSFAVRICCPESPPATPDSLQRDGHLTAEWTARQIAEAFPWDSAPRYLLHDRDCIYGAAFHERVGEMGILEVLTAPRAPWQNAYAERFIGSLRRECLDHIVIFNESSLKRILKTYFEYYKHSRTHLSLE